MTANVMFVCTGNVCRSPAAQLIFTALTSDTPDVRATSAGIGALVGHPIDLSTARALERLGLDPGAHRGRDLEPWMADRADIVLTAEVTQRDHVMTSVPAAFRRTFTLKEFVRLARHLPPPGEGSAEAVRDHAHRAHALRGIDGPRLAGADDIVDPYGASFVEAAATVDEIRAGVLAVVRHFGWLRQPMDLRFRRPAPRVPSGGVTVGLPSAQARRPRPPRGNEE